MSLYANTSLLGRFFHPGFPKLSLNPNQYLTLPDKDIVCFWAEAKLFQLELRGIFMPLTFFLSDYMKCVLK